MTPAIILDVLIAVVLIAAVLRGCWRGLFLSLSYIAVLLLSILGAGLGAKALSRPVTDRLTPYIEARIAETVEAALTERDASQGDTVRELLPEGLTALLERMGLTETLGDHVAHRAEESAAALGRAAAAAVARSLVGSVVYAVLYILLFLALTVLLRLAAFSISLILRLPILWHIDLLGGALLGLLQGMLMVWLVLWLLPRFGVALPTEGTHLLRFFTTYGPMGLLSFLT